MNIPPIILRSDQIEGVRQLTNYVMTGSIDSTQSTVCVFGNETGTGKTVMIADMIVRVQAMDTFPRPSSNCVNPCIMTNNGPIADKIVIYVDNAIIAMQWSRTLASRNIKHSTIGTKKEASVTTTTEKVILARGNEGAKFVMTCGIPFRLMIIDEPDTQIQSVFSYNRLKCEMYILVTATWINLPKTVEYRRQNRLISFLLRNVDQNDIRHILIKTCQETPLANVVIRRSQRFYVRAVVEEALESIGSHFAKLFRAGAYDQILLELGIKNTDSIIDSLRKKWENEVEMLQKTYTELVTTGAEDGALIHMRGNIARKHARITNLVEHVTSMKNEDCPICFDAPLNVPTCLECGHLFCFACITKWSNDVCVECPLCRAKTALDKLVVEKIDQQDGKKEEQEIHVTCDKNAELVKLIREQQAEGRGALVIYSDERAGLLCILKYLQSAGIEAYIISGNSKKRSRIMTDCQTRDVVLLLDGKRQAAGIDGLQKRMHGIINYHAISPAYEEQIIGRLKIYGRDSNNSIDIFDMCPK